MLSVAERHGELRAVLSRCDDDDTPLPTEELPLLLEAMLRAELELKAYLSGNEHVLELATECSTLCEEGRLLREELSACEGEVQGGVLRDVECSLRDHDAVARELDRIDYSLQVVSDVLHCGKYLNEYDEHRRAGNLTAAAERLADIADFLAAPVEGFCKLAAFIDLNARVWKLQHDLGDELAHHWNDMLSWELCDETDSSYVAVVRTRVFEEGAIDTLLALDLRKELRPRVAQFARFLLERILEPLVRYDGEVIALQADEIEVRIELTEQTPLFDSVAVNFRAALVALQERLDVEVRAGDTLMKLVGKEIGAEAGEVLVEDCLLRTIPTTVAQLKSYTSVVSEAESLQRYCVEIGFFPPDFSIMRFASNVESAFADKCCRNLLDEARAIMTREMIEKLDMRDDNGSENTTVRLDADAASAVSVVARELPAALFSLPHCVVSEGARDIVHLLEVLAEQAAECPPAVAERLFAATRLVFELYEAVMPYHHQRYLLTMPFHVALFHNDCMFLSHYLLTAGERWSIWLEAAGLKLPFSLLDLVPRLRHLGCSQLAKHLHQQRNQLLDAIRCSDMNVLVSRDVLDPSAERALRQCLRQLQLLRNVWQDMLPSNLTTRLVGLLTGVMVSELVARVTCAEDIPAALAAQLADIYSLVLRNTPTLFPKDTDLSVAVSGWSKLQELVLMLSGSLRDIEARWTGGHGPLALHFSKRELRALIKALFQNTQLRADLLAKIK